MKHARFVSRLLNRPQLIAPAAGAAVVAALMPGVRLDGFEGEADSTSRDPREYVSTENLAIIPVVGELVHRGGWMDAFSGVTSYQALADMVTDALADGNTTGILLDIDSPGGEAAGCLDFAEWLAQQRGEKPIYASINQLACSAAYAIASAADPGCVFIGQDGFAGSIGVVSYHTDISQALEKQGVVVTYLYKGAHKVDGAPALPLSEQARDAALANIDAMYGRFCAVVAENRGLDVDAVRATEAGIFRGQAAIDAGLADTIATHDEAIMALATQTAPKGATMSRAVRTARLQAEQPKEGTQAGTAPAADGTAPAAGEQGQQGDQVAQDGTQEGGQEPGQEGSQADGQQGQQQPQPAQQPAPDTKPGEPAAVAEACTQGGHPELIAGLLKSGASMSAVNARITEAKGIALACTQAGVPGMSASLVTSGMSLETARSVIFEAKAGRDQARPTDTAHSQAQGPAQERPKLDHKSIYARMNRISTKG